MIKVAEDEPLPTRPGGRTKKQVHKVFETTFLHMQKLLKTNCYPGARLDEAMTSLKNAQFDATLVIEKDFIE